jgi:hypothetical protein
VCAVLSQDKQIPQPLEPSFQAAKLALKRRIGMMLALPGQELVQLPGTSLQAFGLFLLPVGKRLGGNGLGFDGGIGSLDGCLLFAHPRIKLAHAGKQGPNRVVLRPCRLQPLLAGLHGLIRNLACGLQIRQTLPRIEQPGLFIGHSLTQYCQGGIIRIQLQRPLRQIQPNTVRLECAQALAKLSLALGILLQAQFKFAQAVQPRNRIRTALELGMQARCMRLVPAQGFAQRSLFIRRKQTHAFKLRPQQFQPALLFCATFVDTHGNTAVNLGARDLFQYRAALVGGSLQESGKAALGQQHGTREPVKVHASGGFDMPSHAPHAGVDHLAAVGVRYLVPGRLQGAIRPAARPALAPVAAIPALRRLERHFGKAFAGLARHDLVAAGTDFAESRGAPVKG